MKHKSEINSVFTLLFGISIANICYSLPATSRLNDSHESEEDTNYNPVVFLTVSSLASHPDTTERHLELNWHDVPPHINADEKARVQLYEHDPRDNITNHIVSVEPWLHSDGYYRTSVQFPRYTFSTHNLSDQCLKFWIAYVHDENVLASSCIRSRPHWMYDNKNVIGHASLMDLMIPGTHNAGSYASFRPEDDTVFNRYLINQDESIFNQLVYGIRYLDLRVSHNRVSGTSNRLWITHDVFRTDVPVKEVIKQVKSFLNVTKEIVIMDFHRFVNGFTGRRADNRHRQLITLLERKLGDYMIPSSLTSWVTLNELWNSDKRLYVGYAANDKRNLSRFLFPAVKHLWGNVDKVDNLFNYLNNSICSSQKRLTSAMAQLTPTRAGAIFDLYGGLRKMADEVNKQLFKFFRDIWWPCANVVATDYFLGNNMIELSIGTNRNKFSNPSSAFT